MLGTLRGQPPGALRIAGLRGRTALQHQHLRTADQRVGIGAAQAQRCAVALPRRRLQRRARACRVAARRVALCQPHQHVAQRVQRLGVAAPKGGRVAELGGGPRQQGAGDGGILVRGNAVPSAGEAPREVWHVDVNVYA